MKYVHENHIIHRDLKLENILINFTKHVKISDFGISALVDSYTQTSYTSGIGTGIFMAPELFHKKSQYDYKVDVYSFGVILFFVLTKGQLPEGIPGNLCQAFILPSVNTLGANIIKRCWSLSPKERPSFDEIIEIIISNNFQIIDGIEEKLPLIKDHLKLAQKNFGPDKCLLI
ncbi:hypothetical protein M9Y10_030281 [Tritrichomonas musculus]|uniref:Protein kinase domain-containing protein n=1 Tax=Tritrichomonas musculus TaxID=1915356 RepID=A0ABR2KPI8_9EUKA